jgi:hypothetical protein
MRDTLIDISNPQEFIMSILDNKKNGYYVELGAFHSTQGSNTNLLESELDWSGVSFEIVPHLHEEFVSNRKNPCILGDAREFNYISYFEENNFPKQIDFLQVDIDGGYKEDGSPATDGFESLQGLLAIPLNTYRFSTITFEHDQNMDYRNAKIRDAQREILSSFGYVLVGRLVHEDWWVDPKVIPLSKYRKYFVWNAA